MAGCATSATPPGWSTLLAELADIADGVRLHPLVLDEDLAVLSRLVMPALIIGGIATRPLPGSSLRTTLGLPRPENQFAEDPAVAEQSPTELATAQENPDDPHRSAPTSPGPTPSCTSASSSRA